LLAAGSRLLPTGRSAWRKRFPILDARNDIPQRTSSVQQPMRAGASGLVSMNAQLLDGPEDGPAGRRPGRLRLRFYLAVAAIVIAVFTASGILAWAWALHGIRFPDPAEVTSRRVIVLKAADGQGLFRQGRLKFAPVDAKDMPPDVVNAVLSIEDRYFYQHGAIYLPSILRALTQNTESGRVISGGSTITQQLVKILFLQPERTYRRKLREAAIAIWLEHHLTKDQILTSYLNHVYLGSGATGFPAAAKVYFGKTLGDLTVPEAAMLAGMINAPGHDDPFHDLRAARRRASTVLDAMVANGKLTAEAAMMAKLHPATPVRTGLAPPSTGWFTDWVYKKAAAVTPRFGGTIRIRTTLDLRLQQLAANIVKTTLAKDGARDHASQAALVAMKPDGAVVAMIGGRSYARSQFNRAVQAHRQPGSAFKLFDYYAALRQGFTPSDKVLDAPIDLDGWRPQNYERRYHGEVTLATAFADSLNDATVRLSQEVGIGNVIAAARDLGLRAPLQNNPSLALGTSEVTLLDLTSAYAAVSAGKAPVNAYGISGIKTANEQHYVSVDRSGEAQHSLARYRGELIKLLQGVVEHGTGRNAALGGFAAGKTGTTQDHRDAWFVGFDNSLVGGGWVGTDDHSPMRRRVVGGTLPAKIWKSFMEQASPQATVAGIDPTASETTVGQSEQVPVASDQRNPAQAGAMQSARCNVPACEQFYRSFRLSDCTYQPYSGGPRRICER
jgi:1A family penicillin-binding protein